jgi:hypothetical protein
VWEIAILIMLIGALVLLVGPRLMRGPKPQESVPGTLLVTGVSPRPDVEGEQFVTITGVITGPTVNEHVIYQRMAVDVNAWPRMGDQIPVVYSAKNPDNWRFGQAEPPPPPIG